MFLTLLTRKPKPLRSKRRPTPWSIILQSPRPDRCRYKGPRDSNEAPTPFPTLSAGPRLPLRGSTIPRRQRQSGKRKKRGWQGCGGRQPWPGPARNRAGGPAATRVPPRSVRNPGWRRGRADQPGRPSNEREPGVMAPTPAPKATSRSGAEDRCRDAPRPPPRPPCPATRPGSSQRPATSAPEARGGGAKGRKCAGAQAPSRSPPAAAPRPGARAEVAVAGQPELAPPASSALPRASRA